MQLDPLPEPLGLDHARGVVGTRHRGIVAQRVALVATLENGAALGADHLPVGVIVTVLVGEELPALVPAVHIVVAHDVESAQERERRRMAVGHDVVVPGGDRPGRVLAVEEVEEPAEHLRPVRHALLADLVAGAPEDDRRVVAVAADEVGDVALGPLGEVLVVPLRHLAQGPLVERLRHDQEAEAIA